MKYHDKKTLILNQKHLDKDIDIYQDRLQKRLERKKYQKFIDKFSFKLGIDFWECLDDKEKNKIIKEHYYIQKISTRPDWDKWVKMVRKEYLPLYRDTIISKLLDE